VSDERIIRDRVAVMNERRKLVAMSLNAIGLAAIGFAVLRPLADGFSPSAVAFLGWTAVGLAFHLAALYILGRLVKLGD
jgi:hypothetical protein